MWPTTASRSMPCGAPQGRGSSSRGPACHLPRRSWAMPASIPPAATSLWPASRSASAACRWRTSPASRRGCDEHIHQQFRTPHRGDARMANLAGTQPARHAERDDGFRQVLLIAAPGETVLTRELATAWCRDTATGTWGAYRSRAVREFGKYLQLAGVDGFIVPSAWIARPVRGLPHMFTDEELAAFFRAADSIDAEYRSPFREYTIPVIFRLILGAGLRPHEARRLRRRDVDAEGAMVVIERAKRNKDRRVPVSSDLAGLLARFDHLVELRRPDREWFFEDQHGCQYSPAWLIASYHRCCQLAGGIAPASTPYTLRHNYATRTLMRWVEEGKDIAAWLPYLSAYMGHQKYSSTAWYVHLLPERLAAAGLTCAAGIIPAVTS